MGNGIYFKMIRCCDQNKNQKNMDIEIEKNNIKNFSYINYKNKNLNNLNITEEENQNKSHRVTKPNQSSGSESIKLSVYIQMIIIQIKKKYFNI